MIYITSIWNTYIVRDLKCGVFRYKLKPTYLEKIIEYSVVLL